MMVTYIEGYDSIRLAYVAKYSPSSPFGIILLHGLAEHKGRYVDFMDKLYTLGISVFALDLRGHGESFGKRGDVRNFEAYISDIHCLVCKIKEDYPGLKLAILGHSLGGLIATVYAATYNTINWLILSNPLWVSPKKAGLLGFLPYKVLGFVKVKKRHSESSEMLAYSYNDPLATNYLSIRLLGFIFHQGTRRVNRVFDKVKVPTLLLAGELDPLIDTSVLPPLLDRLGSKDKEIRVYKNVKHRLFQSEYRDVITEEMVAWITSRL